MDFVGIVRNRQARGSSYRSWREIFIIRSGRALFTIGDRKIEALAGDILLGPANIPHKYHSLGPGLLESIDVHLSDSWIQTDLDDPELAIS